MRALGLHLLLLSYHEGLSFVLDMMYSFSDIGHPAVESQRMNFRNFNGEDIECFNRKLSQATISTSSRSNVRLWFSSYFILFGRKTIWITNTRCWELCQNIVKLSSKSSQQWNLYNHLLILISIWMLHQQKSILARFVIGFNWIFLGQKIL